MFKHWIRGKGGEKRAGEAQKMEHSGHVMAGREKRPLTEQEEMFKHFFSNKIYLYQALLTEAGRIELKEEPKKQWIDDVLEHCDHVITKGPITDEEKTFCSEVILLMLKMDKDLIFDKIEALIGNEHIVKDLISHNDDLGIFIENMRAERA